MAKIEKKITIEIDEIEKLINELNLKLLQSGMSLLVDEISFVIAQKGIDFDLNFDKSGLSPKYKLSSKCIYPCVEYNAKGECIKRKRKCT